MSYSGKYVDIELIFHPFKGIISQFILFYLGFNKITNPPYDKYVYGVNLVIFNIDFTIWYNKGGKNFYEHTND